MKMDEIEWRLKWADYFAARAKKSRANAREQEPNQANVKTWLDIAAGEHGCELALRSGEPVEQLMAALSKPSPTGA